MQATNTVPMAQQYDFHVAGIQVTLFAIKNAEFAAAPTDMCKPTPAKRAIKIFGCIQNRA